MFLVVEVMDDAGKFAIGVKAFLNASAHLKACCANNSSVCIIKQPLVMHVSILVHAFNHGLACFKKTLIDAMQGIVAVGFCCNQLAVDAVLETGAVQHIVPIKGHGLYDAVFMVSYLLTFQRVVLIS